MLPYEGISIKKKLPKMLPYLMLLLFVQVFNNLIYLADSTHSRYLTRLLDVPHFRAQQKKNYYHKNNTN